jgi:hypothetical protein
MSKTNPKADFSARTCPWECGGVPVPNVRSNVWPHDWACPKCRRTWNEPWPELYKGYFLVSRPSGGTEIYSNCFSINHLTEDDILTCRQSRDEAKALIERWSRGNHIEAHAENDPGVKEIASIDCEMGECPES